MQQSTQLSIQQSAVLGIGHELMPVLLRETRECITSMNTSIMSLIKNERISRDGEKACLEVINRSNRVGVLFALFQKEKIFDKQPINAPTDSFNPLTSFESSQSQIHFSF